MLSYLLPVYTSSIITAQNVCHGSTQGSWSDREDIKADGQLSLFCGYTKYTRKGIYYQGTIPCPYLGRNTPIFSLM